MAGKSNGTGPDICCKYDALPVWRHRKRETMWHCSWESRVWSHVTQMRVSLVTILSDVFLYRIQWTGKVFVTVHLVLIYFVKIRRHEFNSTPICRHGRVNTLSPHFVNPTWRVAIWKPETFNQNLAALKTYLLLRCLCYIHCVINNVLFLKEFLI